MKIYRIILACCLVLTGYGKSDETNKENLKEPNIGQNKGFGAQLWIVDDPDFFERWNTPSEGIGFQPVNKATRGAPVFVIVTFAGPGSDEKNLCDITLDLLIENPEGEPYGEIKEGNCWKELPPPEEGQIQLSQANMGIVIEDKDPSGRYTVKAVVHDRIKDAKIELLQYFDVTEKE